MSKKNSISVFLKAQVSAFSGGLTDYVLMILLTEMLGIHFAISIVLSGIVGGTINFILNRFWAFKSENIYATSPSKQFMRFFTIVLSSVILKSAGTYQLHQSFAIDYRLGRLLTDSFVSYGFNYPMMKLWVFKTQKIKRI